MSTCRLSKLFHTTLPVCRISFILATLILLSGIGAAQDAEKLWSGARKGDLAAVKKAVESGVSVDAKTDYGATALSFAADRGHLEVVKFLLERKADPNVKDTFYGAVPMDWASGKGDYEIMKALVLGGATKIGATVTKAVQQKDLEFLEAVKDNPALKYRLVKTNLELAKTLEWKEGVAFMEPLFAKLKPDFVLTDELAKKYSGFYLYSDSSVLEIGRKGISLTAKLGSGNAMELDGLSADSFAGNGVALKFVQADDKLTGINWTLANRTRFLKKITAKEAEAIAKKSTDAGAGTEASRAFAASSKKSREEDLAVSSANWPQFRGNQARGVGDGQNPPIKWNVKENKNVAWKTAIPGLGHSCPVVWGDHVFVTTAISESDTSIKTGLYGDVASVEDDSEHEFVTYCLDKTDGKIVWKKTACKAVPKVKRHLKSTHANSSVATNGNYVVSWFGTEGVYCYSMEGKLLWKKDLGLLDSGWFYDREYQWQFGASPIIHEDKLILQCDIQDQSFIGCYDIKSGDQLWNTKRDEIPSWSTPTIINTPKGKIVVTNATKAARAYDFKTGKELWRIENNSEIVVPTPFSARGLIFVSSGYRPIQPIYAIRLDAMGDLTLEKSVRKSEYVAWSESRGGPYMPSPIVYGDYLYTCSNSGILTCYQATSGEQVYKKRLRMKGTRSFVGSPIAADGYLFLTSEDGETAVVKAGPKFELVANNFTGETCLTTAAISEGAFLLRTQKHLIALKKKE